MLSNVSLLLSGNLEELCGQQVEQKLRKEGRVCCQTTGTKNPGARPLRKHHSHACFRVRKSRQSSTPCSQTTSDGVDVDRSYQQLTYRRDRATVQHSTLLCVEGHQGLVDLLNLHDIAVSLSMKGYYMRVRVRTSSAAKVAKNRGERCVRKAASFSATPSLAKTRLM